MGAAAQSRAEPRQQQAAKPSFLNDPVGWLGAWIFDPDNFSDFLMVLFTLALTVVAFKQHFLEEKLATDTAESIKLAKQSADAATKAADAMEKRVTVVERPYLFFTVGTSNPLEDDRVKKGDLIRPMIDFKWRNSGRTPAISRWTNYQFHAGPNLPDEPVYVQPPVTGETIIPASQYDNEMTWKYTMADGVNWLTPPEVAAILSGDATLYLYGIAEYGDVFDNVHQTGFCLQWVMQRGHQPFWSAIGGPQFNFRKTLPRSDEA